MGSDYEFGRSGWLEYFANGPNADFFAPAIEDVDHLLISSINIYEVFKRVLQQRGEDAAHQAAAVMMRGKVIEVDAFQNADYTLKPSIVQLLHFDLAVRKSVMRCESVQRPTTR